MASQVLHGIVMAKQLEETDLFVSVIMPSQGGHCIRYAVNRELLQIIRWSSSEEATNLLPTCKNAITELQHGPQKQSTVSADQSTLSDCSCPESQALQVCRISWNDQRSGTSEEWPDNTTEWHKVYTIKAERFNTWCLLNDEVGASLSSTVSLSGRDLIWRRETCCDRSLPILDGFLSPPAWVCTTDTSIHITTGTSSSHLYYLLCQFALQWRERILHVVLQPSVAWTLSSAVVINYSSGHICTVHLININALEATHVAAQWTNLIMSPVSML